MATWTDPKTWSTGEALTASDMNLHIRDNLLVLRDPPGADYICDETAYYSTTSTSFVDVDAVNLALTIVTTGGDVLVGFAALVLVGSGGIYLAFDVDVDGTPHAGDGGIIMSTINGLGDVSFTRMVTGLDAGTHTFKLRWRINAGEALLYAGEANDGGVADVHPQFWAKEI